MMATKPKTSTRLQLLQQLTNTILDEISCLEDELSTLTSGSNQQTISQTDVINNDLSHIRRYVEILFLKQKYLTRVNHRLRHRIKHLNHHCM